MSRLDCSFQLHTSRHIQVDVCVNIQIGANLIVFTLHFTQSVTAAYEPDFHENWLDIYISNWYWIMIGHWLDIKHHGTIFKSKDFESQLSRCCIDSSNDNTWYDEELLSQSLLPGHCNKTEYRTVPTGHLCCGTRGHNNIAVAVHTWAELAMSSANNQCTWSGLQPDIATTAIEIDTYYLLTDLLLP